MNPGITFWLSLFGSLALETTAVILVAAIIAARLQHGSRRRLAWQGALCATLLLALGEISGLNRLLPIPTPSQVGATSEVIRPTRIPKSEPSARHNLSLRVLDPTDAAHLSEHQQVASANSSLQWIPILWLAGFCVVLGRSFLARLVFSISRRRLACMTSSPQLSAQTRRLAVFVGIHRHIRVFQMDRLPAPIVWGFARPAVCFPASFCEDYTEQQREVMILHELAHLKANDPLWLIVSDLMLALLWWQPAIWWACFEFRAACELSADEMSLALEHGPETLAEGLVTLGKRLPVSGELAVFGMAGNGFRSALAQRVQRLLLLADTHVRPICHTTRFAAGLFSAAFALAIACVTGMVLTHPQAASAITFPELWRGSPLRQMLALLQPDSQSARPVATPQPDRQIHIEVKLAEITGTAETLRGILGTNLTPAPLLVGKPTWKPNITTEIEIAARTNKNIQVDFLSGTMGSAVLLNRDQTKSLIALLTRRAGVDLLSTPSVSTLSGRHAQIAVTEAKTVVTWVERPNPGAKPVQVSENTTAVPDTVNYISQVVQLGPTVDLLPKVSPGGKEIEINMISRLVEFLGYNAPPTNTVVPRTNTLAVTVPYPHFRIRQATLGTSIPEGHSVLLTALPISEQQITKDSVPVLGELPVLGGFFRNVQTNTVQKQLIILVTPSLMN